MNGVSDEDIAVYICPTWVAFLQEHSSQTKSISVWEILDEDNDFPWADYHGEVITVQDCWRAYKYYCSSLTHNFHKKMLKFQIIMKNQHPLHLSIHYL